MIYTHFRAPFNIRNSSSKYTLFPLGNCLPQTSSHQGVTKKVTVFGTWANENHYHKGLILRKKMYCCTEVSPDEERWRCQSRTCPAGAKSTLQTSEIEHQTAWSYKTLLKVLLLLLIKENKILQTMNHTEKCHICLKYLWTSWFTSQLVK